MNGRLLTLVLFGSLGVSAEALARDYQGTVSPASAVAPGDAVQLAQVREVEVFYDRYGREVLVDVYTGEVISVRDPQSSIRRFDDRVPQRDRYYLDDPDDVARLRRERRMEELRRGGYPSTPAPLPEYRDYRAIPDPRYDGDYVLQDPGYDDPYGRTAPAPAQPGYARPLPPRNDAVERAPLNGPSVAGVPETGNPDVIIEQPPSSSVIPNVTDQPAVVLDGATEDIAKIQILLGRAGAHPGVIDGRIGDNVNKAISAYRELTGETLRTYDKDYVEEALARTGGEAFTTYEITPVDVAGPFVASVPTDYGEKAKLDRLSFTSVAEKLAERFHMDEKYLRALNPGVSFDRPGTIIKVANVGKPRTGNVTRIVADKGRKQVRAYGEDGKLIAVYPSTIGSAATPSPSGTHTVERIALNPEYTYNPKINFQQGNNDRVLRIPPGPNGPVGTVWIALSKPTYGIHGTPDPSKIGKTESNGCIRLTNWNAEELAKMVKPGTVVEFVE